MFGRKDNDLYGIQLLLKVISEYSQTKNSFLSASTLQSMVEDFNLVLARKRGEYDVYCDGCGKGVDNVSSAPKGWLLGNMEIGAVPKGRNPSLIIFPTWCPECSQQARQILEENKESSNSNIQ